MAKIKSLTAVLIISGERWVKKLHLSEMTKPIWRIQPTARQLESAQWLRSNGWEREC